MYIYETHTKIIVTTNFESSYNINERKFKEFSTNLQKLSNYYNEFSSM